MDAPSMHDPFVFVMDPSHYIFMAEHYAERQEIILELEKARRENRLDTCRECIDSFMHRTGRDDASKALLQLCRCARFIREVKAQIGYTGRSVDQRTREDLLSLLKGYVDLIQPAAVIGRYGCSFGKESVKIRGLKEPIRSRSLCRFFTGRLRAEEDEDEEYATYESDGGSTAPPGECCLFAATIGPGIDGEVARLLDKGEHYRALILNGIGAAAADMVGLDIELYLNREGDRPDEQWRRFHVGYGDFKLEEQRRLFGLLDPGRIGIELNESCVMIPEKSVSGMVALKRSAK